MYNVQYVGEKLYLLKQEGDLQKYDFVFRKTLIPTWHV